MTKEYYESELEQLRAENAELKQKIAELRQRNIHLRKENLKMDIQLNNINDLMWDTWGIRGKEFGREEGNRIMEILNDWAINQSENIGETSKIIDEI
jgi:hypothetical protein